MIKFRAWWIEQEVMCDVDVVGFSEGAITISNENTTYQHLGLNEVELMQSTGLKDKNGVEIFEGDVISELSEQGEDWANHILAEVVWHKAGFYGKEKGHEPEYPITEFVKGEVIGNIYEKEAAE